MNIGKANWFQHVHNGDIKHHGNCPTGNSLLLEVRWLPYGNQKNFLFTRSSTYFLEYPIFNAYCLNNLLEILHLTSIMPKHDCYTSLISFMVYILNRKHVIHHSSQRMVSSIIPAKLKYTIRIHIIIPSIPNIRCCQHFGISDNRDIKLMKKLKFWPRITWCDWPSLQQVDLTLEKKFKTCYACKSP